VLIAAVPWFSAAVASQQPVRLAAAWDGPRGARVGILEDRFGSLHVAAEIEVPTRAHGIVVEPEGTLLAVARRPGDWLLRWRHGGRAQWAWNDAARRYNGHVRRRGGRLYATETDLETGQGRVVVRDARSLEVQAVWSSGGVDPHDLLFGSDGFLWVANGGIASRPETGRIKLDLETMDSSLVCLEPAGTLCGQWRSSDRRLSLRHLALCDGTLGIALQAEHDDAARRAEAPVLAVFDGKRLDIAASPPLAGYGGDIAATTVGSAAGFAVSVPRAGGIALFDRAGRWHERVPLDQACALATTQSALYAGGQGSALALGPGAVVKRSVALKLDNHWDVEPPRGEG
jgi:hypothetical protein